MTNIQSCNFDSVPLAQSQQVRTPSVASFNYTNQDFWSMKARLIKFINERFSTDFNDFVESSIAIMLIENWAFIADMLSFKIDQIVNEIFIDTVTEIENAFRLAKLVGFQPQPPLPATAMFSATINSALTTDLVMTTPIAIDVTANNVPTTFELFPADQYNNPLYDDDIVIPAGVFTNISIVGVEGRTTSQTFLGDGTPNQNFALAAIPVIFDSVRVDVDGVRWEQVDFFTDSQQRREFRVEFDSKYQGFVIFGNNQAGLIPSVGSTIVITYRTGGGSYGNIVANFVNVQRNFVVEGFDFSIPVSFVNYTKGSFGYDGDGIDDIKQKLPAYIRTQNRAVTGSDYKTLTDQFASATNGKVGKSTAVLRNYGCAGNIVDIFVLALDGSSGLATATDGLKVELNTMLDSVKMLTDYVCIRDGEVVLTDVVIGLTVDKFYRKFREEINSKVNRRIQDFFALSAWDYGQTLRDTDIVKALADISEITRADVSLVTNNPSNSGNIVTTLYYQIIRPQTITVSFTFE